MGEHRQSSAQLVGECFYYHDFILLKCLRQAIKNLHTKLNPNSHLIKNLSGDKIFIPARVLERYLHAIFNNAAFSR